MASELGAISAGYSGPHRGVSQEPGPSGRWVHRTAANFQMRSINPSTDSGRARLQQPSVHRDAGGGLGATIRANDPAVVFAPIGLNDLVFGTNNRAVDPFDVIIGEETVATIGAVDIAGDEVGG